MSLHRDVAEVLKVIHAPDRPTWDTLSLEGARASYIDGRAATEPMPVAEVRDLSIPGPHGPIPLRLYRPAGAPAAGSAALAAHHADPRPHALKQFHSMSVFAASARMAGFLAGAMPLLGRGLLPQPGRAARLARSKGGCRHESES